MPLILPARLAHHSRTPCSWCSAKRHCLNDTGPAAARSFYRRPGSVEDCPGLLESKRAIWYQATAQ